MKIGTVVSAENILIEITLPVHVVVRRILSNISGGTGPIFAIFSPYESALRAHDGSLSFSSLLRDVAMATKNVAEMKANRYYKHSLHVRQMAAWFYFATTYY